jgi:cytochrome c-type biogenesis protein CcmH
MGQLKSFILVLWLVCSGAVVGQDDVVTFSEEGLRERYQVLIAELRCPKCQNQNLADSNSMIAEDLRKEVHRLLEEGRSDAEIVDFLVARYGDFVRYRPPLKSTTLLLWGLPAVFILVIVLVPIVLLRRQRRSSAAVVSLTERDSRRLQRLLKKSPSDIE